MEPSLIIVGEARCVTTSLFNYICQNSKVLEPIKKEIHFFDYNYKKTLKFLDVEYEPIDFKHFNKGFNKIENPKFRDNLAQHFKKENQKLFSLLNKRFDWNLVK